MQVSADLNAHMAVRLGFFGGLRRMFSFLVWQACVGFDSQLAVLIKFTIDLVVLSVNLMD